MKSKDATVLSAEIIGFAELSANYSSKEFNSLFKEFFEMTELIFQLHKGMISKFSGDSFLVVFGKKDVGDFSELYALEGASEFQERLKLFVSEKNLQVNIGFKSGISTGEAIIAALNTGDKKQITVMGKAVNNAKRLRDFADVHQILVCGKIFKDKSDQYEFQKLESLPIRGSKEYFEMYELKGKKRIKIQPQTISKRKISSVMVGRHREIDLLEDYIKNLPDGKGTVINIVGKAGIGKSRLLDEIMTQPIFEGLVLLQGTASSIGKNLSYHPIISIFKSWARINDDDSAVVSTAKLQKEITRVAAQKANEIYPFLATMMGLPLTGKHKDRVEGIEGEALEKLILKNTRDLIITAVKITPLIIVIEDMHWADSSSISILESLFKLSENHRVLFINVLRPGYKETGDYILKYLVDKLPGNHIAINIEPLLTKESSELIGNLLHQTHLPDKINKIIIKKTEGNPFFIEEVIRSFIDDGIIEIKDNKFRVTEKIQEANIPETINEVILTRVDKLDEKTKELLRTASVIGRNFYYKVLEEAADTIGELDSRIEYLKDVQLISDSKPKEEIEYLFKHALAQQLTYDSIIQQSRKELHLKIAKSIEKIFANSIHEHYGSLAYHYTKAENQEKAIKYLIMAGDESKKSGASFEVLTFYKDALNLMPENRKQDINDKDIRDLGIKIAMANLEVGKNIEACKSFELLLKEHFNKRFSENEIIVKIKGITSALLFMFMISNQSLFFKKKMFKEFDFYIKLMNNWGYAMITLNPKVFALNMLPQLKVLSYYDFKYSPTALSFFTNGASLFNWTGISLRTGQKIINFSQNAGIEKYPNSFVSFRMIRQMQNYYTGNWMIDEDYTSVYDTGIRQGAFWNTTIYIFYTGMIHLELGMYPKVSEMTEKLEELADTFDNSHAKAQKIRFLAIGSIKLRKFENLIGIIDEGIAYIRTTGHEAMLLVVYCIKAQLYIYLGKLGNAGIAITEAEKLVDNHKGVPIYNTQYLLAKAKLEFKKLTDIPKTDKNFKFTLRGLKNTSDKLISQSKKNRGMLTEVYLVRADISYFLTKYKQAFKYYGLAIDTGEKYKGKLELSRAYFETGKFLLDPNTKQTHLKDLSGNDYLEKAKTMFEEMDLQWDLEEYYKYINIADLNL